MTCHLPIAEHITSRLLRAATNHSVVPCQRDMVEKFLEGFFCAERNPSGSMWGEIPLQTAAELLKLTFTVWQLSVSGEEGGGNRN